MNNSQEAVGAKATNGADARLWEGEDRGSVHSHRHRTSEERCKLATPRRESRYRSAGISLSTLGFTLAVGAALLLMEHGARAAELTSYSGAELYQRFCASCHGRSGLGDGPVASQLKVLVPDLTRLARRHGGEYPAEDVRRIVDGRSVHMAHGTRTMPVWGYEFRAAGDTASGAADELVRRLVEYLRSIQID